MIARIADVDWERWRPRDVAAVTYLTRSGGAEVLLMHKKRGLGAGKINAPGGRLEPGETAAEAAVREFEEEVGLRITGEPRAVGVQRHQFVDGLGLEIHLFVATGFSGTLVETDEAKPFWNSTEAIPYGRMWADNRLWLHQVLDGAHVSGRFVFDGDAMLDYEVRLSPDHPTSPD